MTSNLMVWLIAAPAVATLAIPAIGAICPRRRGLLFILAHIICLALSVWALATGPARLLVEIRRGSVDVQLGFVQDEVTGLALVIAALVLLILGLFTREYVARARLGTAFQSLLLLEQAAVNLVLLAGDLLALYTGLVLLSFALILIVGIDFKSAGSAAALRLVATVEVPAAVAFVGFWLIDARAGTLALSELSHSGVLRSYTSSWMLVVPIVIALVSRAGLVPLQNWVVAGCRAAVAPGAIALAGVALPVGGTVLARLAGEAIPLDPSWLHGLTLLGTATVIVGGVGALRESSALGWLGYLAAGQVGLAAIGLTSGSAGGRQAGLFELVSAALATTLVGMGIGLAIRATQQSHLAAIASLPRDHRARAALLLGLLALAPVPPFACFTSLRLLMASLLDDAPGWGWIVAGLTLIGETLLAAAVSRVVLDLIEGPSIDAADVGQGSQTDRLGARAWPPTSAVSKDDLPWEVTGALAIAALLIVLLALAPIPWLSSALKTPLQQPSFGADLVATTLALLTIAGALTTQYGLRHWRPPAHLVWLATRVYRQGKLDLALDPYVLVGGIVLAVGRLSAVTLDQTLGRLARVR